MTIDRATFDVLPGVGSQPSRRSTHWRWPTPSTGCGRCGSSRPRVGPRGAADGRELVSVWRRTGTQTAALVIGVDDLLASVAEVTQSLEARFSLEDSAGRLVWGVPTVESHVAREDLS